MVFTEQNQDLDAPAFPPISNRSETMTASSSDVSYVLTWGIIHWLRIRRTLLQVPRHTQDSLPIQRSGENAAFCWLRQYPVLCVCMIMWSLLTGEPQRVLRLQLISYYKYRVASPSNTMLLILRAEVICRRPGRREMNLKEWLNDGTHYNEGC